MKRETRHITPQHAAEVVDRFEGRIEYRDDNGFILITPDLRISVTIDTTEQEIPFIWKNKALAHFGKPTIPVPQGY